jgi:predicted lipid-binding transport protein (Tim44 family)
VAAGAAVDGTAVAGPASTGNHLGMPIRVPQTSLAPQLRARRGAGSQDPQGVQGLQGLQAAEDEDPGFGPRSPEATRSMLTMMQQGWRRGRMDDLDDPEGAPGMGTD